MRELATVMAHAFHQPEKLNELFKPDVRETLRTSQRNPEEWDQDAWWSYGHEE